MTDLLSPRDLPEALELLASRPELCPIAGCTDAMVRAGETTIGADGVVDLLRIPELCGVCSSDDCVEIGATTTFSQLRREPLVRDRFPALADAAAVIGGWQIQNRATIGGNIVNASPAGDSLPVLLALAASVVVANPEGEREVPLSSFYRGYRDTELGQGELLTRVRVPWPSPGSRQFFRKVGARAAQAISKVVVAMVGRIDDGLIVEMRLAAGSVAAVPLRLVEVEEAVIGQTAEKSVAELAGKVAGESVTPIDDVRSTADYRRYVLGRVVRRMMLGLISAAV